MTLDDWLNSYTHQGDAQLVCSWRKRSWRALRPVVEKFVADRAAGADRHAESLMVDIEAARQAAKINPDGKLWKQELHKLVEILRGMPELWPAVTEDDRAACAVATDLVELGRYADAIALMRAQCSPYLLSQKCPACSQPQGYRCEQIEYTTEKIEGGALKLSAEAQALKDAGEQWVYPRTRIVPHEARLM